MSEITRIYVTGSCDGLDRLREGLAEHPELDFVGWSENVAEAISRSRRRASPGRRPRHTVGHVPGRRGGSDP